MSNDIVPAAATGLPKTAQIIPFARHVPKPPFEPVPISFRYSNEEWATDNLSMVRLATAVLTKTYAELEETTHELLECPELFVKMLTELERVEDHLLGLSEGIRSALARVKWTVLEIERKGAAQ